MKGSILFLLQDRYKPVLDNIQYKLKCIESTLGPHDMSNNKVGFDCCFNCFKFEIVWRRRASLIKTGLAPVFKIFYMIMFQTLNKTLDGSEIWNNSELEKTNWYDTLQ
eukprot:sb/3477530/